MNAFIHGVLVTGSLIRYQLRKVDFVLKQGLLKQHILRLP